MKQQSCYFCSIALVKIVSIFCAWHAASILVTFIACVNLIAKIELSSQHILALGLFASCVYYYSTAICYTYTTGSSALPDIYAQALGRVRIYQAKHECLWYKCYVPHCPCRLIVHISRYSIPKSLKKSSDSFDATLN